MSALFYVVIAANHRQAVQYMALRDVAQEDWRFVRRPVDLVEAMAQYVAGEARLVCIGSSTASPIYRERKVLLAAIKKFGVAQLARVR